MDLSAQECYEEKITFNGVGGVQHNLSNSSDNFNTCPCSVMQYPIRHRIKTSSSFSEGGGFIFITNYNTSSVGRRRSAHSSG